MPPCLVNLHVARRLKALITVNCQQATYSHAESQGYEKKTRACMGFSIHALNIIITLIDSKMHTGLTERIVIIIHKAIKFKKGEISQLIRSLNSI